MVGRDCSLTCRAPLLVLATDAGLVVLWGALFVFMPPRLVGMGAGIAATLVGHGHAALPSLALVTDRPPSAQPKSTAQRLVADLDLTETDLTVGRELVAARQRRRSRRNNRSDRAAPTSTAGAAASTSAR